MEMEAEEKPTTLTTFAYLAIIVENDNQHFLRSKKTSVNDDNQVQSKGRAEAAERVASLSSSTSSWAEAASENDNDYGLSEQPRYNLRRTATPIPTTPDFTRKMERGLSHSRFANEAVAESPLGIQLNLVSESDDDLQPWRTSQGPAENAERDKVRGPSFELSSRLLTFRS